LGSKKNIKTPDEDGVVWFGDLRNRDDTTIVVVKKK
jgi:hypothetical protein